MSIAIDVLKDILANFKVEKKWLLLVYNVLIWIIFFAVYASMMSSEHFHVPDSRDYNTSTAAYFSVVVHATVGFGDIYPVSQKARTAVALHISLVILGSLGIYLLPIDNFALKSVIPDMQNVQTGLHSI